MRMWWWSAGGNKTVVLLLILLVLAIVVPTPTKSQKSFETLERTNGNSHSPKEDLFDTTTTGIVMTDHATSWPELVGMDGQEAKAKLEATSDPNLKVYVLSEGSIVTMDYRTDRVRIFVDSNGNVSRTPQIG